MLTKHAYLLAEAAAANSRCLSRKIGAVAISISGHVLSVGYNGPHESLTSCDQRLAVDPHLRETLGLISPNIDLTEAADKCPRQLTGYLSGDMLSVCPGIHAEIQCIINNQSRTPIHRMYLTCGIPCHNCLAAIMEANISYLHVTGFDFYDEESKYMLSCSDIKVCDRNGSIFDSTFVE